MEPAQKLEAWEYNPSEEDQRCEHKYSPNRPVSPKCLEELGVLSWKIDVEDCDTNPALEKIKKDRGYKFWETVTVAPGKLENYEAKLVQFFQEHLHPYDESRLILQGSGFWDVRSVNGDWIRFRVEKGDMIVLPPGMYHRFTLDTHNYIKAMLLYTETPTRIDVMCPDGDDLEVRKEYVNKFLVRTSPQNSMKDVSSIKFHETFIQRSGSLNYHDELMLPISTLSLQDDSPPPITTRG